MNELTLGYELGQLNVLLSPRIKLLELCRVGKIVKNHLWPRICLQVVHEVIHRLRIDVIVRGDSAHVCTVDLLSLTVEADKSGPVKLLNDISDLL